MPVTIRSSNTTFLPPSSYSYTSASRINRSSSPTASSANRYSSNSSSFSRTTSHRYSSSNGYDSATVPTRVSYTNYGEHSSSTPSSLKPPTGSTRSRLSDYRNGTSTREPSVTSYNGSASSLTALGNGRSRYSSGYHSTSSSSASSSKRHPSTSLSVATVAADLYDKYSPSNYKSNVELSRSRSLSEATSNRLLDNAYTYSTSPSRAASRDRESSALPAAASAADRASLLLDPTAAITSKVKSVAEVTPSRCQLPPLNSTHTIKSSAKKQEPQSHIPITYNRTNHITNNHPQSLTKSSGGAHSRTQPDSNLPLLCVVTSSSSSSATNTTNRQHPNNNNTNHRQPASSQSPAIATGGSSACSVVVVSEIISTATTPTTATTAAASLSVSSCAHTPTTHAQTTPPPPPPLPAKKSSSPNGAPPRHTSAYSLIPKSHLRSSPLPSTSKTSIKSIATRSSLHKTMNTRCKATAASPSATEFNTINNNNNSTHQHTDSTKFYRENGVNPLVARTNFLQSEYELARSQVVPFPKPTNPSGSPVVRRLVAPSSRHSSTSIPLVHQTKHRLDTNNNTNSPVRHHSSGSMDDIKFIDSDDSDHRRHPSPCTDLLTRGNVSRNKEYFNRLSNGSTSPSSRNGHHTDCGGQHLTNGHSNGYRTGDALTNGRLRAPTPPPPPPQDLAARSTAVASTTVKHHRLLPSTPEKVEKNGVDATTTATVSSTGSVRNASLRNTLPPKSVSPSRYNWDRTDTGRYNNHRTLSDSAAASSSDVSTASAGAAAAVAVPSSTASSSGHGSRSSLYSEKTPSDEIDGLCGLRNIGNTCFMNSVIQCLSHTRELTDYLRKSNDTRSTTKDQRIFYEFAKLIREMWTPRTRTVTPSELKSAFSSKHRMYSGCAQQDAQEFLRFFLDSLHNASNTGVKGEPLAIDESQPDNRQADQMWQWYTKVENSVVQDLFVGQFKSSLNCTVCGNSSVTFDPFWDLSVPLQSPSRCKLESCLDFFIKEEVLDGDEMPTCSKCKTRRKSTKSFTIQRFPKYLVIHLKRFSETRWSKMTNIVEFPTGEHGLDMTPYAATPSSSAKYTLYGISNHMGSTAGGHYVALCKHPLTKKWHEFNDNIVTDACESQLVSSSAYLLFYERAPIDPTKPAPYPYRLKPSPAGFGGLLGAAIPSTYRCVHYHDGSFPTGNYAGASSCGTTVSMPTLRGFAEMNIRNGDMIGKALLGLAFYVLCLAMFYALCV